MLETSPLYAEHPQDVLHHWLRWRAEGPAALVVITAIEGGSVRDQGSLMAVAPDGRRSGYISGGCIDADVALRAREALESNQTVRLRYGAGSPFIDMPLPCGGAIELAIYPDADEAIIRACHDRLAARKPAKLRLPGLAAAPTYFPKLRVRIAGRGADALALARLVQASGYELALQLRDGEDVEESGLAGLHAVMALKSPGDLPAFADDPWTAFVLMFHDTDWDLALLKQALLGDAFYIGSVGSYMTQMRRRERLAADGVSAAAIEHVHGPVGLVPSTRDASMLAVSALAEIIAGYRQALHAPFEETAILLLAAGQSRRFGNGDKLLAPLNGKRVIDHSARALADEPVAARVAVVGPDHADRRAILEAAGWQVLENPEAQSGQASSIRSGLQSIARMDRVKHVIILLADMPYVPDAHLHSLRVTMEDGAPAALSIANGVLCPPSIFAREAFAALLALEGDAGAKSVFKSLSGTRTVELYARDAADIDTVEDLAMVSTS